MSKTELSKKQEERNNLVVMKNAVAIGATGKAVGQKLQMVAQLEKQLLENLEDKKDYGIIPGTAKPTLLKTGADKITNLYGLRAKFYLDKEIEDYEEAVFSYRFRCELLDTNGNVMYEGYGSASTKEPNRKNQDPFALQNTVMKIAKKRAKLDATVQIPGVSAIFTQDLDENATDILGGKPRQNNAKSTQTVKEFYGEIKTLYGHKSTKTKKWAEFKANALPELVARAGVKTQMWEGRKFMLSQDEVNAILELARKEKKNV